MSGQYDNIQDELKERDQWLLWDSSANAPRRPHWGGDFGISWSDPSEWHSFEEAVEQAKSHPSWGIGYVFALDNPDYPRGLYGCIDIDGGLDEQGKFKDWVPDLERFIKDDAYMERSPSGTGVHIPFVGHDVPDWWTDSHIGEHEGVDVLTNKFATFTGDTLEESGDTVAECNPLPWLFNAYANINGENPKIEPQGSEKHDDGEYDGDEFLDEDDIIDALEHISPDVEYNKWRNIGFSIHSFFDGGQRGKQIFEDWSRGGEKWDDKAQRYVNAIWESASPGDGITVATLIHHARNNGWEMPSPNGSGGGGDGGDDDDDGNDIYRIFKQACRQYQINPRSVGSAYIEGEKTSVGVEEIIPTSSVGDAVMAFNRSADNLDGTDKQAVIGYVVIQDMRNKGEFFQTDQDDLYYFYDDENRVYDVDGRGNKVLDDDFRGLVHEQYHIFAGQFSRNLGTDIKTQAKRNAPIREAYRFAHYNDDDRELYITDWDTGYYAVTPDDIEWRPNGTDVFFLPNRMAEAYEYQPPSERIEIPDKLPGERGLWGYEGDALMRMFGNRVNYADGAATAPADQRKQLYIHLHTLPFVDELLSRPIMAWVGEKGSGKTVIERSIGKFIYGSKYTESVMPDARDDFIAKVTNQALAFIDNYDEGESWANDILAAVATSAGIDKRELYTTNKLRQDVVRCWLSVTSREAPFRRDDVADRLLLFKVERVPDDQGFVGMGDYLKQVTKYRNTLWSVYLDNLQAVVTEYVTRDTGTMSSSHRMADWAIFAKIIGDALNIGEIDDLLETMETERAYFALENEIWANQIIKWARSNPEAAAKWRGAGDLYDLLEEYFQSEDEDFHIPNAQGLGKNLSHYENELNELVNLEIDSSGRVNEYRFDNISPNSDAGLNRY